VAAKWQFSPDGLALTGIALKPDGTRTFVNVEIRRARTWL
jgi:hypothetical protein